MTLLYSTIRFVNTSPRPKLVNFDSFTESFRSNTGKINLVLGKLEPVFSEDKVAHRLPSTQQFDKDTFSGAIRLRFGGLHRSESGLRWSKEGPERRWEGAVLGDVHKSNQLRS